MQFRFVRGLCLILVAAGTFMSSGAADASSAGGPPCTGNAPALAITGLCPEAAHDLILLGDGDAPMLEQGCRWVPGDAILAGGDALLFMAAQCNGETAGLAFVEATPMMELQISHSAIAGDDLNGSVPMARARLDGSDAEARILGLAREAIEDPTGTETCHVRPADLPGWPSDALVVDVSAEEAAKAPKDEPRWACGDMGYDEDQFSYWRAFQGFVWFFQLGQDAYQDVDPRSLTVIRKDASGQWQRVAD